MAKCTGPVRVRCANGSQLLEQECEVVHCERYAAQGGDLGAVVSPHLGRVDPVHVAAVHVNAATVGFMPFPPLAEAELAELTDSEKARVERLSAFMSEEFGFAQIQSTRPQTLGYGLTDSPIGQLAWIVEKMHSGEWPEPTTVPTGVAVFAEDIAIRRYA